MPTTETQKAYSRGYYRGRSRMYDYIARLTKIAKAYREMARGGAVPSESICRNCDRWTRGGPSCVWGDCRADFEIGVESRMWSEGGRMPKGGITTTEDFGCINWIPKQ